ncbi:MAG: TetR/AcrR family transcriptional regulator [Gemmatimonadota bacterium]
MDSRDTQIRILEAAERLFAETGVEAASVRAITAAAGVNLAAVHYHFGSKEGLARAVIARRLGPINGERLRLLDAAEVAAGSEAPGLEAVLAALVGPILRLRQDPGHGGPHFMCLLARLYHGGPRELKGAVLEEFRPVRERFMQALARNAPHLSEAELAWRVHFAIGALLFTAGGESILEHFAADPADPEVTERCLVGFLAAGLRAPGTGPATGRIPGSGAGAAGSGATCG